MKLAYISMFASITNMLGVNKKIRSQISQLNSLGIVTTGYLLCENLDENINNDYNDDYIYYINISLNDKGKSVTSKLKRRKIYIKQIIDILERTEWDFVYFRYITADLNLLELVKKYPNKVVFEHQTKELDEIRLRSRNLMPYLSERIFAPLVYQYAGGCVGVTSEITRYEIKRLKIKENLCKTISNGFDVDEVPIRKIPIYDGNYINMLFVGNLSVWHGIDRLITGISRYYGNVKLYLNIVGDGDVASENVELARKLGIEDKVIFHGNKKDKQLSELYNDCHIAIGCLGVHRKKTMESASLKVREYLARGIPFVLSDNDVDLVNNKEIQQYYLQIPANDDYVDVKNIIDFVDRVYQDHDHPNHIRQFAIKQIDMAVKMKELKDFFESLSIN